MLEEPLLGDDAEWKARFRTPEIMGTEIAKEEPDRGLVISTKTGVAQLYAWDVPIGDVVQLTHVPHGVPFGTIAPDGRYVYYLDDEKGNEIGHYVRVPFEGGEPQDMTPDMPPYSSWGVGISRAGNRYGFMHADAEGFTAFCMSLTPGEVPGAPEAIYQSKKLFLGPALSHSGEIAVIASAERTGKPQYSLIAIDTSTGERIGELWDGPGTSMELPPTVGFSPIDGDLRLLATTDKTGVERLLLWDPRKGERRDLDFEGVEGAVRPFDWSSDGLRILFRTFNEAVQQLYVYNLANSRVTRLNHPPGTNFGFYFGPEGDIYTHLQTATHPTQLVALDSQTGAWKRTIMKAGEVPPSHPWKSVTFTSSDGQRIQGWLSVPEGKGPFPVILETHGGPEAVQAEEFVPPAQSWVDHGFAYLTINYRGSTTFGREFREKIWENPGHWEVEDMAGGYEWLVKEGIARPNEVLLTGWSYGGYLTLHALGKRPDLWAAGMAGIAIADWALDYEDAADTLKGYDVVFFGGTPEEKPERYEASSPITNAEAVQAPVLVIQGRNDTRCTSRQMEVYEKRMKDLGKSIQVLWFDAGHVGPFTQIQQAIEYQELMLRFAYDLLRK